MKIIEATRPVSAVGALKHGTVFYFGHAYHMIVDVTIRQNSVAAVDLETGYIGSFDSDTNVQVCENVEVYIND